MKEAIGDLWDYYASGAIIAVPVNGSVRRDGSAVMGAGFALQAKRHFPGLAKRLGTLIQNQGNHVFDLGFNLVSFPTKQNWWERGDLGLIERSCEELTSLTQSRGWRRVLLPRPGCGNGKRKWEEVLPILARYFDNRFIVVEKDGNGESYKGFYLSSQKIISL